MRIRPWLFLVLFIASALLPVPAASGQGYTVLLANGNSLAANSYTIEGEKIYLRFPIGEAAFRLSEVVSIKDDAGNDMLFQEKGVYVPPSPVKTEARPAEPRPTFSEDQRPVESWHTSRGLPGSEDPFLDGRGTDVHRQWSPAHYSAQAADVDSFIDKAFEAEDRGEDISEEEYDRAFSSFFEEDSGDDAETEDPNEDW